MQNVMPDPVSIYEQLLIEKLRNNDTSAFTVIFSKYYKDLVCFSFYITHNSNTSEELVQDVFLKLWENRNSLQIHSSLKSFLLKSVQNRSIDYVRHMDITQKYSLSVLENPVYSTIDTDNYLMHSELEELLEKALKRIPVANSEAFRLSRFDGMNYHAIADKLGISVRTVEVRVGKALSLLRQELKDFLS
jgi:RNA polymerase sigma-70 factor (family 1)